jgi:hypothetical protein
VNRQDIGALPQVGKETGNSEAGAQNGRGSAPAGLIFESRPAPHQLALRFLSAIRKDAVTSR